MVDYLNSLRTQQQETNATYVHEARQEFLRSLRQRASWFPEEEALHAPTRLDQLASDLAQGKLSLRMVFLTGDAGDGKTAFCAKLARELGSREELRWETIIGRWRIIKDASEVDEDVLRARLTEHLAADARTTLVVAINEGRLRRLFRAIGDGGRALWTEIIEPALQSWLSPESAAAIDAAMRSHRVLVLNFRHRFHLRAVTSALVQRWTEPAYWEASLSCGTCPARARCPILANAIDLRSVDLQKGIEDVLAWCHFSGQRLPFRRLQAVLALATTGGLRCADVVSGAVSHEPAGRLLRFRFYNALFLREPLRHRVEVRPEPIARAFAAADPERFANLDRDRAIDELIRREPTDHSRARLKGLEAEAAAAMRSSLAPFHASEGVGEITNELAQLVRSLRRYLAFTEGPPEGLSWRRTLSLVEGASGSDQRAEDLQRHVVEALNRLHRVEEVKREVITGNQIDPAGFRSAPRQVLELRLGIDFPASVVRGPVLPTTVARYLESAPSEIYLEALAPDGTTAPARLRLDARFVDILQRVLEGYTSWQALGPYRRDLARFHARLMASSVTAGHRPQMTIRVGPRRYSVSIEGTRLRFEGQG
jgi:hypothetical protein